MSQPLSDSVAVVTGASSGIGNAIAIELAACGAKVAVAARRLENLEELVKTIKDKGGEAIAIQTDVTDKEQVLSFSFFFFYENVDMNVSILFISN